MNTPPNTVPVTDSQEKAKLAKKSAIKTILFGVAEPEQLHDKVGLKKPRHPYELITEDDDDKRPVR